MQPPERRAQTTTQPAEQAHRPQKLGCTLRRIPSWIGSPGRGIDDAEFIPIRADMLPDATCAWERYRHEDASDRLVQLAIRHAEFEALHPFLDDNGRLGRMLVPLFLRQIDLLRVPLFYISAYFETHRSAYYDGLLAVAGVRSSLKRCRRKPKIIWRRLRESLTCTTP